jgi:hypothetical protein
MNNSHGLISAIELNYLKYLFLLPNVPLQHASTMPLDPSKHHQDRRRLARDPIAAVRQDGMFSREIEMKRNRGEISCAECRRCVAFYTPQLARSHPFYVPARLKIKCDKQIPCQSCQVRPAQQLPEVLS